MWVGFVRKFSVIFFLSLWINNEKKVIYENIKGNTFSENIVYTDFFVI